VFFHNLYLSGDNANPGPVILRGNIVSNDTSGSQIRIGGTVTNNLWIRNPYAHSIGMPAAGVTTIDNNVYTSAVAFCTAYGWGSYAVVLPRFLLQSRDTYLFQQHLTNSVTKRIGIEIEAGFTVL
jgi:hypothetical protein